MRGSRELLVAICVCTAKEHVSYHLHALHGHFVLTRLQQMFVAAAAAGSATAEVDRR